MNTRIQQRVDRVNGVFLRAIGRMTLADYELRVLRDSDEKGMLQDAGAWVEFADHLRGSSEAVAEAASGSVFSGNTISVLRQGVRVPVGVDYIDRLADKMERHVKVGRAMGIGETAEATADGMPVPA